MSRLALILALPLFFAIYPAMAQDGEDTSAEDLASIKSCLAIASAKEESARAAEEGAPSEDAPPSSPEAWFTAAATARAEAAQYAAENCIGIVTEPCTAEAGYSATGEHACVGAEKDAWDTLLNEAWRERLGLPPGGEETADEDAERPRAAEPLPECMPIACEISAHDNLRKTQRAFAAWREAICLQNYIESGGGRENQIDISRCHMNLTAQQVIWLQNGQAFGQ